MTFLERLTISESKNHQNTVFLSQEITWMQWTACNKKLGRENIEYIFINGVFESALY